VAGYAGTTLGRRHARPRQLTAKAVRGSDLFLSVSGNKALSSRSGMKIETVEAVKFEEVDLLGSKVRLVIVER
jgi:hypothetical protein